MPGTVRVEANPLFTELPNRDLFVEAALLKLHASGPGQTKAEGTPVAAKLEFSIAFVERARNPDRTFAPLASLAGSIQLSGKQERPLFTIPESATFEYDSSVQLTAEGVRTIAIHFDGDSFAGAPASHESAAQLKLPAPESKKFRFAEIGVALSINGEPEASVDQNDRLDVVLGPVPIRLLLRFPERPDAPDSIFRLTRDADGMVQSRRHNEDLTPGDGTVDLLFESVLADEKYTLAVVTSEGRERTVFRGLLSAQAQ